MAVHIMIPTLQGVSAVQQIIPEDPDVPSVVCLNGSSQSLPISNAYYDFVKKGQGVIARAFGHGSWRVDLSAPVEMGSSWQLGLYLAHYFQNAGVLGDGEPGPGDTVLWATGAVKVSLDVEPVEGVDRKLEKSQSLFRRWRDHQVDVVVVMCAANHRTVDLPAGVRAVTLDTVDRLDPLLARLEGLQPGSNVGSNESARAKTGFTARIALLMALLAMIGAGIWGGNRWIAVNGTTEPPALAASGDSNSPSVEGQTESRNSASMWVVRKEAGKPCEASTAAPEQVGMMAYSHFRSQRYDQTCSLSFQFPTEFYSVLFHPVGTNELIPLRKHNGRWSLPASWQQPLPSRSLVLGFSTSVPASQQRSLEQFLYAHLTDNWINAADMQHLLRKTDWRDVTVYGVVLEQF